MDNQHKLIKGYRDLSQEEVDLMNAIKEAGNGLGVLVDELMSNDKFDKRWISIGKTHLQQGIMAIIRGIAQPESF